MVTAIALVVGLGLGFGAGRIKNAAKLAAVKAKIAEVEAAAKAEELLVVAKIKSVL